MGSGYLHNPSDRTFQEFVHDSVGRNIYDTQYPMKGQSKAKQLSAFIKIEPNHIVDKVFADLVEHAMGGAETGAPVPVELQACLRVATRLRQGAPLLEELVSEFQESTFRTLTNSVRKTIEENQPEAGLDRFHTCFVAYIRQVCEANGITTTRDEPAHSVLGKYVKSPKVSNRIESEMNGRILTNAQSTMDAFNRVRIVQSLAHPNPIPSHHDAFLIFTHVVSVVNLIRVIEQKPGAAAASVSAPSAVADDGIPFCGRTELIPAHVTEGKNRRVHSPPADRSRAHIAMAAISAIQSESR